MTKGKYTKEWLESELKDKVTPITNPKFKEQWDWQTTEVFIEVPKSEINIIF
jgi:hypothetical protein